MKKIIISMALAASLYAADNNLYDNSVAVTIGHVTTRSSAKSYSGASYGIQINRNLNTSEGARNIDALQFTYDYANLDTPGREYAILLGTNALWYLENNQEWTPFFKLGMGIKFGPGSAKGQFGDHFFATFGVGMEYLIRGDISWMAELTDHAAVSGENTVRLSMGIKYSFGQGY